MTRLHPILWSRRLTQASLGSLLLSLVASPLNALASPGLYYDYIPGTSAQPPLPPRSAYAPPPPAYSAPVPQDPAQLLAQQNERCNIGRLVGGIVGGGLGYATSRQEGRTWAVPLGALLGQQVGCSIGAGRGPRPW